MDATVINPNIAPVPSVSVIVVTTNSHQLDRQSDYLRHAKVQLNGETSVLLFPQHENIEDEFYELVKEWKSFGRARSLIFSLAMHPAYQKIIGMGKPAIPLILRELNKQLDHWFWALESISRENPVPEESKGDIEEMAKIWLRWGRKHGYVR